MNNPPHLLNYAPPPKVSALNWIGWLLLIFLGVAVMLTAVGMGVYQQTTRMDAVSGSSMHTRWILGCQISQTVTPSPLQTRLESAGIAWTPNWVHLTTRKYSALGGCVFRACSSAPAIYSARPLLPQYANSATDEELRLFIVAMQFGNASERQASVTAMVEQTLAED